jgi:hypothetical protein
MQTKHIDLLNVGLIFVSLLAAFYIPFELFLFSYAVLGPLHYMTEMNWLKEKRFFIQESKWAYLFVLLAVIITISAALRTQMFQSFRTEYLSQGSIDALPYLSDLCLLTAFLLAIGLMSLKKWQHIALFLLISLVASALILKFVPFSAVMIGVFIPSVMHVYVFTLLFMIFGYLNAKTTFGLAAILAMIACPIIIMLAKIDPSSYQISDTTKSTFLETGVALIIENIGKIAGKYEDRNFSFYSAASIKAQIFIAFAYTYHYLNWFSKTSIIGWSKGVSKTKIAGLVGIWLAAIWLYYTDYKTGLIALFFLSILHIILEFPLNFASIQAITAKISKR